MNISIRKILKILSDINCPEPFTDFTIEYEPSWNHVKLQSTVTKRLINIPLDLISTTNTNQDTFSYPHKISMIAFETQDESLSSACDSIQDALNQYAEFRNKHPTTPCEIRISIIHDNTYYSFIHKL